MYSRGRSISQTHKGIQQFSVTTLYVNPLDETVNTKLLICENKNQTQSRLSILYPLMGTSTVNLSEISEEK